MSTKKVTITSTTVAITLVLHRHNAKETNTCSSKCGLHACVRACVCVCVYDTSLVWPGWLVLTITVACVKTSQPVKTRLVSHTQTYTQTDTHTHTQHLLEQISLSVTLCV